MMSASPLPVLLVIADQQDFYYREYSETRTGIEGQGVSVVVAATTTNPSTPHWGTGQPEGTLGTIVPDVALGSVNAADYSAIAFVGGWGASMYQYAYNDPNGDGITDNYYSNPLYNADPDMNDGQIAPQKVVVNDLINDFLEADKPVAGICHGMTVLAWARVDGVSPLEGKQVAVPHQEGSPDQFYNDAWRNGGYYSGQRDQVLDNGGIPTAYSGAYGKAGTADDVIVDGRIITGENPNSAALFGTTIGVEVLANQPPEEEPPVEVPPVSQPPVALVDGNLVVTGTPGDDTVYLWSGAGNQAFAWLNGEAYGPFALPKDGRVVVHGGDGDDQIFATDLATPASIYGGGGHDLVTGGSAGDLLDGGDGVDRLSGNAGDDIIIGGAGTDYINGNSGNDVLVGGDDNDSLDGESGRDILIGGLGADHLRGGSEDDALFGFATAYDADDATLATLRSVWVGNLTLDLDARIGLLTAPVGVGIRIGDNAKDDGVADTLVGGEGNDFGLASTEDAVYLTPGTDRVRLM